MAIMATASIEGRPREAVVTALGAMSADAVWLLAVTAGFIAFLHDYPRVVGALGVLGGGLLLWMAWGGYRSARRGIARSSLRGSYRLGFLTVLTSPFSLGWWMASGPIVIASLHWQGIAGLFSSILVYAVLFAYALRWLGERVKGTAIVVAYVGVAMLGYFGFFFAREGVRLLFAP